MNYRIEVFEGPLDVLLQLIHKNKINIYDVPIAFILKQYQDFIDENDLEYASEFAAMAAQLLYIKSRMLLPRKNDEEDPRDELVHDLLEYQKYKNISRQFAERISAGMDIQTRNPMQIESDMTHELSYETIVLKTAFMNMQKRIRRRMPPPLNSFDGIVGVKEVPVFFGVIKILRSCMSNRQRLNDLFYSVNNKTELISVFLAVLELVRVGRIEISEETGENDLWVSMRLR